MDKKQKKYLYIGLGIVGPILLAVGSYFLYQYLSGQNLTPEQQEIANRIKAKEALQSHQAKGDMAFATRV